MNIVPILYDNNVPLFCNEILGDNLFFQQNIIIFLLRLSGRKHPGVFVDKYVWNNSVSAGVVYQFWIIWGMKLTTVQRWTLLQRVLWYSKLQNMKLE